MSTSDLNPVVIIIKKKSGKVIDRKTFPVLAPPAPVVTIDSITAQFPLTNIPKKIILISPKHLPILNSYQVSNWKAIINDKEFVGNGSYIYNNELINYINAVKSGTIIFKINYVGSMGHNNLTEIFQFFIEGE